MKLGHNLREGSDPVEAERKSITTFKEWRAGVVIFIAGNIANFLSFGFAAQSMLASLGTIQFVSNVCFAHFVLRERVTRRVLLATACIVGGCITLVLFGNHESADFGVEDMMRLYARTTYVVYLFTLLGLIALCYTSYRRSKKLSKQGLGSQRSQQLQPLLYAAFSAMLGSQSVLMAKTLSQLLRTTLTGDLQALVSWFTYTILVVFVGTASFWATRLNKSLQLFPALTIVPLMQINWTLFSIVSGGMYFKEFEAFTGAQASLFVLGVLVVLAGVILLSWNPADSLQRYDPMKAELPLAHGVPDAPPEVCRTRDLQEGGFDWVDLEDGEGGDGHGAVTNPMASASVGLPRDWRSLRINETPTNPMFEGEPNGGRFTLPPLPKPPPGPQPSLASPSTRSSGLFGMSRRAVTSSPEEARQKAERFCGDGSQIRSLTREFVEDLSIDMFVARSEGWGLGLPSASGRAPMTSVFGLPPTPAASSCGGDDVGPCASRMNDSSVVSTTSSAAASHAFSNVVSANPVFSHSEEELWPAHALDSALPSSVDAAATNKAPTYLTHATRSAATTAADTASMPPPPVPAGKKSKSPLLPLVFPPKTTKPADPRRTAAAAHDMVHASADGTGRVLRTSSLTTGARSSEAAQGAGNTRVSQRTNLEDFVEETLVLKGYEGVKAGREIEELKVVQKGLHHAQTETAARLQNMLHHSQNKDGSRQALKRHGSLPDPTMLVPEQPMEGSGDPAMAGTHSTRESNYSDHTSVGEVVLHSHRSSLDMEKDDFSGPSLEDSGLAHAGSSHGFQKFLKKNIGMVAENGMRSSQSPSAECLLAVSEQYPQHEHVEESEQLSDLHVTHSEPESVSSGFPSIQGTQIEEDEERI
eukprot:CAMPEP_0114292092 /NCGR_PEP_ID=MMETSP0059-20121206/8870_1 /TAXON_ID=36894 /ORGANISM="Pyramimonas parkeae, Strain CCMP726" /LENGTH=870 /DNA_ID=CAMNT_0001413703 /DNA_START=249 /DNA_END=2861 /DNA_ORIENTATION=-